MRCTNVLVAATIALSAANAATAQQFDLRMRFAAPGGLKAKDSGIVFDVDQSGGVDVLLKGGSVLMADGNLGFTWSPPGGRIQTVSGLPNFFELAGDVDGNGTVDLVSFSIGLATLNTDVFITYGSATGSWGQRVLAGSIAGMTSAVQLTDVDGDTFPDILLRRFYPTAGLGLLRNLGNGTFTETTATSLPAIPMDTVFAMGDATGDGAPDLVVRSNGALVLLFNIGTGVFTPVISGLPAVANLQALHFADADADGDQDLLVATGAAAPLQLWLGAGNGTFTAAATTLPAAGTGRTFADLDNDQRADLLVIAASPLGQQLHALRNAGPQFVPVSTTLVDATLDLGDPVLADLEPDGDLDAIVGGALVFLHRGSLQFAALQREPVAEVANEDTVAAGDVDGDEDVDLIVGDTLHLNDGDGWFTNLGVVLPPDARGRALVDLDNDDDLEVVWTRTTQTALDGGIMANQNGVLVAGPALTGTVLLGRVEAADFDNDGLLDLISERGFVLRNLGGLTFATAATFAAPERFLTVGDFDGDAQIDIVTTQPAGWTVWRNTGNFVFTAMGAPQPGNVTAAVAGHFDNDTLLDLATAYATASGSSAPRALRVWTRSATGWVAGPVQPDGTMPATTSPVGLAAGDLDGDGDLDLVGYRLWENNGGQFVDRGNGVGNGTPLVLADLEGDRDLDVVRAAAAGTAQPTRCQVFANRLRDLDADRLPLLGYQYTITMASRAGSGTGGDLVVAILAATRIPATALPGIGVLHVDPLSLVAAPAGVTASTGLCSFGFALPPQPALAGLEVYWQGAIVAGNNLNLTGLLIDRLLW